jgi:hypothetical protein
VRGRGGACSRREKKGELATVIVADCTARFHLVVAEPSLTGEPGAWGCSMRGRMKKAV